MEGQFVSANQVQPIPDRSALRAGLEAARTTFRGLVDSVSDDRWCEKSPTSAWTMGEVLVHLAWALEQLPKEVDMARRGQGMFNMPKWLADPGSYWLIRWQTRRSNPESVRRRYDNAIAAAIAAIEIVPDTDWALGAPFYGHGFHSVADLFRVPVEHLAEHTVGWEAAEPAHPGNGRG